MKKSHFNILLFVSSFTISTLAFAEKAMPNTMSHPQNMVSTNQQNAMQQKMFMRQKQMMMQKMAAYKQHQNSTNLQFPTPQELAKMTPPKPMNKAELKKRLDAQIARVQKVMNQDKAQADKYAEDFARYQKYQADTLAKMMAKANKQREQVIKRMKIQHAKILENFDKSHAANK